MYVFDISTIESDNYVPHELEEHEHIEPPDEDDVIAAIGSLKNNKAPGSDDLPAELFKTVAQS